MKKEIINVQGIAKPPGPFNHVVRAGGFLFITSQLSADLKTNKIMEGNIAEQTKRALENLKFLIESAGGKMEDIVKVSVFMKDINDFEKMNEVYREYFKEGQEPARVTVQALSPIKNIEVEIEATAVAREKE